MYQKENISKNVNMRQKIKPVISKSNFKVSKP